MSGELRSIILDTQEASRIGETIAAGEEPLATRARFVSLAAGGASTEEIAAACGCPPTRVRRWLDRFRAHGLDGLADRPRSGAPATEGGQIEVMCTCLLSKPPNGHERWSLRDLAGFCGLSHSTVRRWLQRHAIALERVDLASPGGAPPYPLAGLWLEPPVHLAVLDATGTRPSPFGGAATCPRGPAITTLAGRLLARDGGDHAESDGQWRDAGDSFLAWLERVLEQHGDSDLVVLCDCAILCGDPNVRRLIESAPRVNWLLSPRFLWWHRFAEWACLPPERGAWDELNAEAERWRQNEAQEFAWCRSGA